MPWAAWKISCFLLNEHDSLTHSHTLARARSHTLPKLWSIIFWYRIARGKKSDIRKHPLHCIAFCMATKWTLEIDEPNSSFLILAATLQLTKFNRSTTCSSEILSRLCTQVVTAIFSVHHILKGWRQTTANQKSKRTFRFEISNKWFLPWCMLVQNAQCFVHLATAPALFHLPLVAALFCKFV